MVPTWLTARKLEDSLVIIFKRKNSKFYLSLTVSTQANMTKNLTALEGAGIPISETKMMINK